MQALEPVTEYSPSWHGEHALAALAEEYLPVGQAAHDDALPVENPPAGHPRHVLAPAIE
jgi:hypothetical protein